MKTNKIKTKVIAFALVGLTAFGAVAPTANLTQAPPVARAAEKTDPIEKGLKFVMGNTFGYCKGFILELVGPELVEMGLGPAFKAILGIDIDGKEASNEDVMEHIDKSTEEIKQEIAKVMDAVKELSEQTTTYHTLQMNQLRAINSNIDTKDFRAQADKVAADFANAFTRINEHRDNFTSDGSGKINHTTYKAYKEVLADPHCNVSTLQADFDEMLRFLKGERTSNNCENGYRQLTRYLLEKIVAADLQLHSWTKTPDYTGSIEEISAEIRTMEEHALLDFAVINVLNSMARKVKEYEIDNDIITVNNDEAPYAKYNNVAKDMLKSIREMDRIFDEVMEENKGLIDEYVKYDLIVNDGDRNIKKGCTNFLDAWSQGIDSGRDFTIKGKECNRPIIADGTKGFKVDNNIKGISATGGLDVPAGRTVTINMGWKSSGFKAGDKADMNLFTVNDHATLNLSTTDLTGGSKLIYIPDGANSTKINVTHTDFDYAGDAGIYVSRKAIATTINLKWCEFGIHNRMDVAKASLFAFIKEEGTTHLKDQEAKRDEYWGT